MGTFATIETSHVTDIVIQIIVGCRHTTFPSLSLQGINSIDNNHPPINDYLFWSNMGRTNPATVLVIIWTLKLLICMDSLTKCLKLMPALCMSPRCSCHEGQMADFWLPMKHVGFSGNSCEYLGLPC